MTLMFPFLWEFRFCLTYFQVTSVLPKLQLSKIFSTKDNLLWKPSVMETGGEYKNSNERACILIDEYASTVILKTSSK